MPEPAIVLANGHFRRTNGKTAHGLVRGSDRFDVKAVVDPDCAGHDAGTLLDGVARGIPVVADLDAALASPATRYLDLDGSLDLARDVAEGGFRLDDGVMRTLPRPGLGVWRT